MTAVSAGGCRCFLPEFTATSCETKADCTGADLECYHGFCVPRADSAIADAGEAGPDADAGEPDTDNDGVPDSLDNCRFVANPGQANSYPAPPGSDAEGDACDDTDGDATIDAADCAAEDPLREPGTPDPCDGADTDCVIGACALDAAGLVPVAAAAAADTVVMTLDALPGPGPGAVWSVLGGTATTRFLDTTSIADPRGVAVNPLPATARVYVAAEASSTLADFQIDSGVDPTGVEQVDFVPPATGGTTLRVVTDAGAAYALAARGDVPGVVFFRPTTFESSVVTDGNPVAHDLTLAPFSVAAPDRVSAIALRAVTGAVYAWLAFGENTQVLELNLSTTGSLIAGDSGYLDAADQPSAHARDLLMTPGGVLAAASYDTATSGGFVTTYIPPGTPTAATTDLAAEAVVPDAAGAPACPRALALSLAGTTLYVADWCNARVLAVTLDPATALLTFGGPVTPVCAGPFALAVASNGGSEVVYVLCDGGPAPAAGPPGITVLGLD
ncbi:MAG TPA: thrombospondin type 3 repeat-containing protein [Myxococcota bacterium]|nr:thrombospondin type 3 repeat-containing protein [Myxococcota bacterium]